MKNILSFTLVLLCIIPNAISQNYTPMVIDHARWIYVGYGDLNEDRTGFEILGDTLINNITYKKAYQIQINQGTSNTEIEIEYKHLIAFLREDISTKKVYCIATDLLPQLNYFDVQCSFMMGGTEFLLYDYDLMIGDTLSSCLIDSNPDPFFETLTVESIFDINYGDYTLRTYRFTGDIHLTEGIGFDNGLFQNLIPFTHAAKGYGLSPYCREVDPNDCLVLSNTDVAWPDLEMFPNPSSQFININSTQSFSEINIYNQLGQQLKSTTLQSTTDYTLPINDLKKGWYLIKIANGNNQYAIRKIFKE